jgi:hypothetical protein
LTFQAEKRQISEANQVHGTFERSEFIQPKRKASMKKIKLLLLACSLIYTVQASAIVQLGAQGNYNSVSTVQSGAAQNISGFSYGFFAHLTFGIPLVFTVGGGPFADFGTLKSDASGAGDITQLRAGVQGFVMLDFIPIINPYLKAGVGYEGLSYKTTLLGVNYELPYKGTTYHTVVGFAYNLVPLIYAYAEGGYTGATLEATLPTGLGTGNSEIVTSGWRASVGVMLYL